MPSIYNFHFQLVCSLKKMKEKPVYLISCKELHQLKCDFSNAISDNKFSETNIRKASKQALNSFRYCHFKS
jgi:hypothetical protein